LIWSQAAVRIYKKDGHIIRCIVQYHEIGRSIAIHVTGMEVIADPKIFQHTRTRLRSYRLKRSITVAQGSPNQFRAERFLLHDHPQIEQTVMIKVDHLELVRRRSADNRSAKRKVSVSRKYPHPV
jgi:hypothetical protein